MEDNDIIELYFQRLEAAIEETAKKYGSYLKGVARRFLYSREDAEEVVEDTYMKTWNAIPPARPSALKLFLTRITRNLSLDRIRYYAAEKRYAGPTVILDELENCLPAPGGDAEDAVERKMLTEALNRFLSELDTTECCVFLSRYFYCQSLKEIEDKYSLSEGRVKYLLSKTRKTLRQRLEKEGFER